MWWMDIETANSWSYSTLLNQGTISGATQFFKRQQGIAVGVYSMPSMWRSITGNYRNKLPVWIAASSASPATFCTSKYGFTGGTVYIVQYAFSGFDSDYACQSYSHLGQDKVCKTSKTHSRSCWFSSSPAFCEKACKNSPKSIPRTEDEVKDIKICYNGSIKTKATRRRNPHEKRPIADNENHLSPNM